MNNEYGELISITRAFGNEGISAIDLCDCLRKGFRSKSESQLLIQRALDKGIIKLGERFKLFYVKGNTL